MFLSGLILVVELMSVSKKTQFLLEITLFLFSFSSVFSHNVSEKILLFRSGYQLENQNLEGLHEYPELIPESQTIYNGV